jgi:peptide/nickel transport system substrate-binding protein
MAKRVAGRRAMSLEHGSFWRRPLGRQGSRRAFLSGAASTALAFGACSTRTSKPTQPAGASVSPKSGGVLQLASANNPPTLDGNATSSLYTHDLLGMSMSRLLAFQTGPDYKTAENWEIVPEIALSAETADAITWTLKLRPDAKFHNLPPVNGHPVEAEDVKSSYVRAIAPNGANRSTFDMVDPGQIQTPDSHTVIFKLKYPYAPFKSMLASPYCWITPREAGAGYDPGKTVIGSGPFVFDGYTPDVQYTVKKSPDFYDKGRPYIDGVHVAFAPDKSQTLAQFSGGHLDVLGAGTPSTALVSDDLAPLQRDNPKAAAINAPGPNGFYIASQFRVPTSPFLDLRVRQAMSLAIDRDALGKAVIGSQYYLQPVESRRWGKWALSMEELTPDTAQWYKFDLAKAKQLLQAAGGTNLVLKFDETKPQPVGQVFYGSTETTYNMLAALPWKISLVTIDYNKEWVGGGKGVRYGNFPPDTIVMAGLEGASDVDEQLYSHFYSKSNKNIVGNQDPTLDAMIDKGRTIVDENERVKAYKEIQQYLAKQLYGIAGFPGWFTPTMVQPWVKNWTVNAGNGIGTEVFAKLWLDR